MACIVQVRVLVRSHMDFSENQKCLHVIKHTVVLNKELHEASFVPRSPDTHILVSQKKPIIVRAQSGE